MMHAYFVAMVVGSLVATDPPHAARVQQPTGKVIYDQSCKKCHGVRGVPSQAMQRMMKKLPVLDSTFVSGLSLAGVENVVKKGKGEMKAVDKLTPEQAAAVTKYVFELANAKPLPTKGAQ